MSVAFRRESDEEHKEPRFELPIPPGPNLVTPHGLAQIEGRVTALEAGMADIRNEAVLAAAKRDLRYWRTRLATAQLQPPPPEDQAGFGSRVGFRLRRVPDDRDRRRRRGRSGIRAHSLFGTARPGADRIGCGRQRRFWRQNGLGRDCRTRRQWTDSVWLAWALSGFDSEQRRIDIFGSRRIEDRYRLE